MTRGPCAALAALALTLAPCAAPANPVIFPGTGGGAKLKPVLVVERGDHPETRLLLPDGFLAKHGATIQSEPGRNGAALPTAMTALALAAAVALFGVALARSRWRRALVGVSACSLSLGLLLLSSCSPAPVVPGNYDPAGHAFIPGSGETRNHAVRDEGLGDAPRLRVGTNLHTTLATATPE